MRATVKWTGEASFEGTSGSGHTVIMDGPPDAGGRDLGVRPMEMLLLGLGGCTAFDVVYILQRGRHPVSDCVVEVEAERADTPPKVFTKIHLHYKVRGKGLKDAVVERAVRLSAEKYCSASIMLREAAELSHDFEVLSD
ncbi:MAG: OsmC family protein [Ectothiorhodospiraceae bacterium]|nr:OsmC family protein [Ectothiorhodospiraceae bacterium]